jgi:hypothetical protein
MSLRFRLNLLISVMFVTILVLGTVLVIFNARRAVFEETQSTARLALQLLEVAYASAEPSGIEALQERLRRQMGNFENARHLEVVLIEGGREVRSPARRPAVPRPAGSAQLVAPAATELRRPLRIDGRADTRSSCAPILGTRSTGRDDARPLLLLGS